MILEGILSLKNQAKNFCPSINSILKAKADKIPSHLANICLEMIFWMPFQRIFFVDL